MVLECKKDTIKVKSSKETTYDLKTKWNKNLKGSSWTHLAAGFWERTRHPITPQSKCCKENVSVLKSHPLSFFLKKKEVYVCAIWPFPPLRYQIVDRADKQNITEAHSCRPQPCIKVSLSQTHTHRGKPHVKSNLGVCRYRLSSISCAFQVIQPSAVALCKSRNSSVLYVYINI